MSLSLLEKIAFIKSKYANLSDTSVIDGWEKDLEKAIVDSSLAEHQGVKDLVSSWQMDINGLEALLSTDRTLTTDERLRIMDKRDILLRFIKSVTGSFTTIKNIEQLVDEAIEHYNKNYK